MLYWILNDQKLIRNELHRCIICVQYTKSHDLPAIKITPSPPFLHCGVYYAFKTKVSKGRSPATLKGYACIFVCIMTKAVHLELVSNLSTEALLAAFKQFKARGGLYSEMCSDHGTNFVERRIRWIGKCSRQHFRHRKR